MPRALIFGLLWSLLLSAQPADRWWRGNLHTHSFWSDGDDFPEMVALWYRENGYHFLALSDHNVQLRGERWEPVASLNKRAGIDALARYRSRFPASWVETRGDLVRLKTFDEVKDRFNSPDTFLLLPSEEITGRSGDGRDLHMNATNLLEELPMEVAATLPETLLKNLLAVRQSARNSGRPILFHLNHPNYKWGVRAEDLAALADLRFFEVWNGVDNDNDPGDATHPSTDTMWDHANALRLARGLRPLYGLATDDAHDHQINKTRARPGRAWIEVRAPFLDATHLFRALDAGNFYSTTGIQISHIHFDVQPRRLTLTLTPRPGESFTTRFLGVREGSTAGVVFAEVTGANPSYTLKPGELYVRALVSSNLPPAVPSREHPVQRAWTQPVGF